MGACEGMSLDLRVLNPLRDPSFYAAVAATASAEGAALASLHGYALAGTQYHPIKREIRKIKWHEDE